MAAPKGKKRMSSNLREEVTSMTPARKRKTGDWVWAHEDKKQKKGLGIGLTLGKENANVDQVGQRDTSENLLGKSFDALNVGGKGERTKQYEIIQFATFSALGKPLNKASPTLHRNS